VKEKSDRSATLIIVGFVIAWLITAPTSFACTPPPIEGVAESWPPSTRVQVTFDSRLNEVVGNAPAPMTTAVNNWNTATELLCKEPIFTFGAGSGETMSFAYGPIANGPDGSPRRGLTTLNFAARITSAISTISSNIPLTFPAVLTETIAHEIGHTMGLNDCKYSNGCAIGSSVMVSAAPVATWTATQGAPGPTSCDLAQVTLNAPDYKCEGPVCAPGCVATSKTTCYCNPNSPIILDLSGNGFELTNVAGGVKFDISGSGNVVQMGWTARGADNAFLALPGADGLVHNGKELFGNFTPQPPSANPNGFAALAVYDDPKNGGNGDGIIDSRDAIFSSLRLWIDANHDGICQPEELHTLPSVGVNSLSLKYKQSDKTDQYGNLFRYKAVVDPDNPSATPVGRIAYDVFFVSLPPSAIESTKCAAPSMIRGEAPSGMLSKR
jgi:hypothetical protein